MYKNRVSQPITDAALATGLGLQRTPDIRYSTVCSGYVSPRAGDSVVLGRREHADREAMCRCDVWSWANQPAVDANRSSLGRQTSCVARDVTRCKRLVAAAAGRARRAHVNCAENMGR